MASFDTHHSRHASTSPSNVSTGPISIGSNQIHYVSPANHTIHRWPVKDHDEEMQKFFREVDHEYNQIEQHRGGYRSQRPLSRSKTTCMTLNHRRPPKTGFLTAGTMNSPEDGFKSIDPRRLSRLEPMDLATIKSSYDQLESSLRLLMSQLDDDINHLDSSQKSSNERTQQVNHEKLKYDERDHPPSDFNHSFKGIRPSIISAPIIKPRNNGLNFDRTPPPIPPKPLFWQQGGIHERKLDQKLDTHKKTELVIDSPASLDSIDSHLATSDHQIEHDGFNDYKSAFGGIASSSSASSSPNSGHARHNQSKHFTHASASQPYSGSSIVSSSSSSRKALVTVNDDPSPSLGLKSSNGSLLDSRSWNGSSSRPATRSDSRYNDIVGSDDPLHTQSAALQEQGENHNLHENSFSAHEIYCTPSKRRFSFYENHEDVLMELLTVPQIQALLESLATKPQEKKEFGARGLLRRASFRRSKSTTAMPSTMAALASIDSVLSASAILSKSKQTVFGCHVDVIPIITGGLIMPPIIESALFYLLRKESVNSVGIFRKSGVKSRTVLMRDAIEKEHLTSIDQLLSRDDEFIRGHQITVHDIADVVKVWLREMKPKPLLTADLIKAFGDASASWSGISGSSSPASTISSSGSKSCSSSPSTRSNGHGQSSSLPRHTFKIKPLKLIMKYLNDNQRILLHAILRFLALVASNSAVNQMNSHNLSICLSPSLANCESEKDIHGAQQCLQYLIDNCDEIFSVSPMSDCLTNDHSSSTPNGNANTVQTSKSSSTLSEQSAKSVSDQSSSSSGSSAARPSSTSSSSTTTSRASSQLYPPRHSTSILVEATPPEVLRRLLYQR